MTRKILTTGLLFCLLAATACAQGTPAVEKKTPTKEACVPEGQENVLRLIPKDQYVYGAQDTENYFRLLTDQRVGVVANQTSMRPVPDPQAASSRSPSASDSGNSAGSSPPATRGATTPRTM